MKTNIFQGAGNSLELPQWGNSNEYPQDTFWNNNNYGKCPKISNTLFQSILGKILLFMHLFFKIPSGMAKSVDPDQTAPSGAGWSGSALFANVILSVTSVYEILGHLPQQKVINYPIHWSPFLVAVCVVIPQQVFIAPDKREYPHNIFLISQRKHVLWVLIRSTLIRRLLWVPTTYIFMEKLGKSRYILVEGSSYLMLWVLVDLLAANQVLVDPGLKGKITGI